jgi:hypothetical protein
MFSMIRRRLCYANVVATLALVFAMSGGALAAGHYLLTSTSQVSPKVLKALKGKNGQTGPAGTQGAQGAQGARGETGAAGTPGAAGTKGETGGRGETGAKGQTGATGARGTAGSPWTAGGTLPSGQTETGSWATSGGREAYGARVVLASFAIPLAEPPTFYLIGPKEGEGQPKENEKAKKENEARKLNGEPELPLPIPADCKGTAEKPQATPGNVCVFEPTVKNVEALISEGSNLGTTGVVASIEIPNEDEDYVASGTWAVTAK